MALTRSFKDLGQTRIAREPSFGEALLREGIDALLTGDVNTGKAILRDYIQRSASRSWARRSGRNGREHDSDAWNSRQSAGTEFVWVIGHLQKQAGVEFSVETVQASNVR
jgi:hypothetical protein